MTAKLLIISDPTAYSDPDGDVPAFYRAVADSSSFQALHLQSQQVTQTPSALWRGVPLSPGLTHDQFCKLSQEPGQAVGINEVDAVFCRSLKPFGIGYLDSLAAIEGSVRFLNRPSSKIHQVKSEFLPDVASDFMPPTLVSSDHQKIKSFLDQYGMVVAKQGNSTHGKGVCRIQQVGHGCYRSEHGSHGIGIDDSLDALLRRLESSADEPLQFMRYLARATSAGDKRVVVVDGEILGAYLRRSASGHWINNVARDGIPYPAEVGDDEREAIRQTWPVYAAMGMRVLGYDFLQDDQARWRISEINVGNICGFVPSLVGPAAMPRFLDWIYSFSRARSSLCVRPALLSDCAAISAIYRQSIAVGGVTMDDGSYSAGKAREKLTALGLRERLLVATRLGEVIGWAELKQYSPRVGYHHAAETSVYVHRSEQGSGVGSQLMRALLEEARSLSYQHLSAKVVCGNEHSLSFHRRFGFELVGKQHRIGFSRGIWHDVMILEMLLSEGA